MGFERICAILQGKQSNYDTDIFAPLLRKVEEISKRSYTNCSNEEKIAFRVIVDHIRAIVFSISDGVIPSNESRGYVIRRIIRRACLYAKKLGIKEAFFVSISFYIS